MKIFRGRSAIAAVVIGMGVAGCGGGSDVQPAFSKQQADELAAQEAEPQKELLKNLEAQFGPDHPEVQQMKMSMGLDETRTPTGEPKQ